MSNQAAEAFVEVVELILWENWFITFLSLLCLWFHRQFSSTRHSGNSPALYWSRLRHWLRFQPTIILFASSFNNLLDLPIIFSALCPRGFPQQFLWASKQRYGCIISHFFRRLNVNILLNVLRWRYSHFLNNLPIFYPIFKLISSFLAILIS